MTKTLPFAASDPSGAVQRQYETWLYPPPIDDLDDVVLEGLDIRAERFDIWPDGGPVAPSILVAGCATFQAAAVARQNPQSRVLGFDISAGSLAATARLKDRHGLDNLELRRLDVMQAPDLGETFDFVSCVGVLHHMADPVAGGRALKAALKPDGVMHLAFHSANVRAGVEMMQRVFKLLDLDMGSADVALVRAALDQVPLEHPVRRFLSTSAELSRDEAIVDTFLSPLDRSLTAEDLFSLIDAIGMRFHAWEDRAKHSVLARLPPNHPLLPRILKLDIRGRAIALDNLVIPQGSHSIFLRHRECDPARYVIDIAGDPRIGHWRIHQSPRLRRRLDPGGAVVLSVDGCELTPSPVTVALLDCMNGVRTIEQGLAHLQSQGHARPPDVVLRAWLAQLHDINFIMIQTS